MDGPTDTPQHAIDEALHRSRSRISVASDRVRLVGVGAWCFVAWMMEWKSWRLASTAFLAYLALSLAFAVYGKLQPAKRAQFLFTSPLLDMPMVFLLHWDAVDLQRFAGGSALASMMVGAFAVMFVFSLFTLSSAVALCSAGVSFVCQMLLLWRGGWASSPHER